MNKSLKELREIALSKASPKVFHAHMKDEFVAREMGIKNEEALTIEELELLKERYVSCARFLASFKDSHWNHYGMIFRDLFKECVGAQRRSTFDWEEIKSHPSFPRLLEVARELKPQWGYMRRAYKGTVKMLIEKIIEEVELA